MKTTFAHRAPTTTFDGRMQLSKVPFVSMCPMCAQMRPQPGYDRNSLLRLLSAGYPAGGILLDLRRVLVDQHQGTRDARRGGSRCRC